MGEMHERNPFRVAKDFAELGEKYPFFAPFVIVGSNGKRRINFKNPDALRALSRALLLSEYSLDIVIPPTVLIPTIPLRVNYILWLEDLISHYIHRSFPTQVEYRGIDIGTGSTAIYSLLGARMNAWRMIGTDIEEEAVKAATSNATNNGLEALCEFVHVTDQSIFSQALSLSSTCSDHTLDFSMCNPPFFDKEDEEWCLDDVILQSTMAARKNRSEVSTEGGEVKFLERMIDESIRFQSRIRMFTTMVGVKSDLKGIKGALTSKGVHNWGEVDFRQGRTVRWGLAWSFHPLIIMNKYELTLRIDGLTVEEVREKVKNSLIKDLEMGFGGDDERMDFVAERMTWSRQRAKRRALKRLKLSTTTPHDETNSESTGTSTTSLPSPPPQSTYTSSPSSSNLPNHRDSSVPGLHFAVEVAPSNDQILLKLSLINGTFGKNGLSQVLQFLKNQFKDSHVLPPSDHEESS